MYILDTDTVSHHQHGHERVVVRITSVPQSDLTVSTITLAEQMRGCWNAVHKARTDSELVAAYDLCRRIVDYYSRRRLVDFSQNAANQFRALRQAGVRVGTQDLRIASIALTLGAVLVSCNKSDFQQVPSLTIEDWTI